MAGGAPGMMEKWNAGGTPGMMEKWNTGGTPGMMEKWDTGGGLSTTQGLHREFRKNDILTGTPEADTFDIEPMRWGHYPTNRGRFPGKGRSPESPKEQPETTEIVVLDDGGRGECGSFGCTWILFEKSLDDGTLVEEVDILVYQEQERANYLEGYQAPTARSYTYIENFDPIEDEIIVGENRVGITPLPRNDIPMVTGDIRPFCDPREDWWCVH